jgi:ribose 5-phosphate isomerase A
MAKTLAAKAGVEFVRDGMVLGLGSGTTSERFVELLADRIAIERIAIRAVATSERTSRLALSRGIELINPESVDRIDLALDGADEVDPEFRMIKGRGGALLREKIVSASSKQRIIMVDRTKLVDRLGTRHELPVEISDFGHRWTKHRIEYMLPATRIRTGIDGQPYRTDGGNLILDLNTGPIADASLLERRLLGIPGVYETGLFIGLCDILIIADETEVEIRQNTLA